MQDAEVVLDVLRERGRKGLPLTQLYRQMFNPGMYLLAYGRIYSNQGAMTPGTCDETADGMSGEKIDEIIAAMRGERFLYPGAETPLIREFLRGARNDEPLREDPLTPREVEVVKLIAESYSTRQIADALTISEKTVDRHRANIFEKLEMHDRVELTRYAIRRGLVEP